MDVTQKLETSFFHKDFAPVYYIFESNFRSLLALEPTLAWMLKPSKVGNGMQPPNLNVREDYVELEIHTFANAIQYNSSQPI